MNTRDISLLYHLQTIVIGVINQLSYRTGAPPCSTMEHMVDGSSLGHATYINAYIILYIYITHTQFQMTHNYLQIYTELFKIIYIMYLNVYIYIYIHTYFIDLFNIYIVVTTCFNDRFPFWGQQGSSLLQHRGMGSGHGRNQRYRFHI